MTDVDTLRAIERNGVAHSVYWCQWPKMRLVDHPHAVVTESDLPCPFFNNVFSADIPDSSVEPVVDDLVGRFRSRHVPCFWWSGPVKYDPRVIGLLEDRGFAQAFEASAMAMQLPGRLVPKPTAAEIIKLDSASQLTDWSRTCADAFGFDDSLAVWWHELYGMLPFGESTPLHHFMATIEGKPAGVASAFIEDGVVGLASVGVRDVHRRQGIGTALTVTALATAWELGCHQGVLFSTPEALPIYEAIGFRRFGTGRCYAWSPQDEDRQTRSWA